MQRTVVLAAVSGALIGTVLEAPARWLAPVLGRASQDRVQMVNTQGTLWNGQAELLLAGGAGSSDALALPSSVSWSLRPQWQQGPALRLALDAPCCTSHEMVWHLGWDLRQAWAQLEAGDSRWPAAWLTGLGAPWNTVRLQGQLQLHTDGVTVSWPQGRLQFQGGLQVQALQMSSSLSTLKPLGDYAIQLAPDDSGTPRMTLSTLSGDLALSGTAEWVGAHWRFQGLAEAVHNEPALSNLLNILGRRDGPRAHLNLG